MGASVLFGVFNLFLLWGAISICLQNPLCALFVITTSLLIGKIVLGRIK